ALFEGGSSVREIARKLGLGRRRVERWVRRIDLPDLNTMASKPCTPAYFGALLARRWAEGTTKVRHLFAEIRHRGYTGSYSHLAADTHGLVDVLSAASLVFIWAAGPYAETNG